MSNATILMQQTKITLSGTKIFIAKKDSEQEKKERKKIPSGTDTV